jgi:hypothetical protein
MITKRKKIKKMEINIKERERERIYTTTRSTSGNRRSRERKSNTHIQQILASPCCGFSSSVCLSPHICTYALSHDGSGRSHIQRPCWTKCTCPHVQSRAHAWGWPVRGICTYAYAQVHSTSSDRNRVRAARPGFRCAVTLSPLHASMPKRTYVLAWLALSVCDDSPHSAMASSILAHTPRRSNRTKKRSTQCVPQQPYKQVRSDQAIRVVVFRVRVVGQPGINGTDPTTHESMMLSRLLWCYTSVSMNKRSLWSCVASSKIK